MSQPPQPRRRDRSVEVVEPDLVVRLPAPADPLTTELRRGESLRGALERVLHERADQAFAVDLSGPRRLFVCDPAVTVAFRPMTRADLADVIEWQAAPHVARWWASDDPRDEPSRHQARVDGSDPTRMWVIEVNGRSVGFVQDYRIGDHPEYAILTGEPDAVAFDYAIGDPAWVGRGVGTRVLWTFLRDVVHSYYPDATTYFAAPDHRNAASLRVLEKLGFQQGLWFDEPGAGGGVDTVVSCTLDVRRIFG